MSQRSHLQILSHWWLWIWKGHKHSVHYIYIIKPYIKGQKQQSSRSFGLGEPNNVLGGWHTRRRHWVSCLHPPTPCHPISFFTWQFICIFYNKSVIVHTVLFWVLWVILANCGTQGVVMGILKFVIFQAEIQMRPWTSSCPPKCSWSGKTESLTCEF